MPSVWLLLALVTGLAVHGARRRARTHPELASAWSLFGTAVVLDATAATLHLLGARALPGPADALGLVAMTCYGAAFVHLIGNRLRTAPSVGPLLDALATLLAATVLVWQALLQAATTRLDATGQVVAGVHAVAWLAVVTLSLLLLMQARFAEGLSVRTSLPLALAMVADAVAGSLGLTGRHVPAVLASVCAVGLVALATAARPLADGTGGIDRPVWREWFSVLAPTVPVLVVGFDVVWRFASGTAIDTATSWTCVLLFGVMVSRLIVALLDGLETYRMMEDTVQERTLSLLTREQWFRSLVQNSSDVVTVVDAAGTITYQTPSVQHVFGHDPVLLVGSSVLTLLRPADARRLAATLQEAAERPRSTYVLDIAVWHHDGRWCETETVVTSLVDDTDIRGLVLTTRDVSERKRLQEALARQAYHDELTGLANRVVFRHQVEQALREQPQHVAVLFLDLDGFKAVNDAHGHALGDALLRLVAERLASCVRPDDLVARLGGDEFAVLVVGPDVESAAVEVAGRIDRTLAVRFMLEHREVRVRASVGIALADSAQATADVLLRNADLAMYRCKAQARGGYVLFEENMHRALLERLQVEDDLRLALSRGELTLHYQPTIDLRTGEVVGVEALMRWESPAHGVVAPERFVSILEDSGLIGEVGSWALEECCVEGARWQKWAPGDKPFHVAVNISGYQLTPYLVTAVRAALAESGLPPSALVLEMTESVLIEHTDRLLDVLNELKAVGVRLAIDDFGTGYSSLSYLSRFPVDVLKVDRSFVESASTEADRAELLRTIVSLGRTLKLSVVAEGIETQAQYRLLRELGCDLGQGYLFSRPVAAAEIDWLLDEGSPAAVAPLELGLPPGIDVPLQGDAPLDVAAPTPSRLSPA